MFNNSQLIVSHSLYTMNQNRELQLQTIIKAQESKIHSLKKELANAKGHDQDKLADILNREKKIIEEKDKTIKLLMEQAQKAREGHKIDYTDRITEIAAMYRNSQQNLANQRDYETHLEVQIGKIAANYQQQLTLKQKQKEELIYQVDVLQRERKKIVEEVQKLNRFYAQSLRHQPDREQTLLWVDKLIQFIAKTNEIVANEAKQREQALLNITLHITQEMKQLNMEYSRNDTVIAEERLKFIQEMQNLIHKAQMDYNQVLKSNAEFAQTLSKLKLREDKEIVAKLESQLLHEKENREKELTQVYQSFSAVEKEKKNLLINIQELKSYYELREKANKEQVDFLKKTIEDLLQSQELREKEFQRQINRMGSQIQNLTVKFYQKVELPINAVYNKIKQQVGKFKLYFEGFFSDTTLQKQIEQFQLWIVEYLTELNQQKQQRQLIKQTALQALRIAKFLLSNSSMPESNITERIQQYSSLGFHSLQIDNKEIDKRSAYELATARKQIQKLKEQNKFLQSKSPRNRGTASLFNDKILDLSAQNELLKERVRILQRNQKDNFIYNEQILAESRIGRVNTAIIERLEEKVQQLLKYINKQQNYLRSLSGCINSLNQILINPVDTFQQLLAEIKSISAMAVLPQGQKQFVHSCSFQEMSAKRQMYRDILFRKHQAHSNIQKTNLQLMKLVRQLLGKVNSTKQLNIKEGCSQWEKPKNSESKQMLQKRVKEVHTQRLKIRQEMIEKLNSLQDKVRTMEQRMVKKNSFNFIKFQESICKKLQEFFASLNPKEKFKDVEKVVKDALNDTKSKLKECHHQNQGLIREINLLKQLKSPK